MARFYNPYHFVPVGARNEAQRRNSIALTPERKWTQDRHPHVTHERHVPGTRSGRLVVRLRTVTPVVVGGEQDKKDKDYGIVKPYEVDGRPAIPGSTLRGLIGSVMEAASNGPLRVLDDRTYSYRKNMDDSLSAIGLVVEEDGQLRLKPMSLPTLESHDGGKTFDVPLKWKRIFPEPQFKIYFGTREQISSPSFVYATAVGPAQAVPMPVKQLSWSGSAVARHRSLHIKANRYAVAQDAETGETPRMGLVRVLGCSGDRKDDMPHTKQHELWIPLPGKSVKSLPILPAAVERFQQLADERTDADKRLPFEPKGTARNPDAQGGRLRLKTHDMVYFDVNDRGEVTEVSFSAIWRGRVELTSGEKASAFSFFRAYDRELLPFTPERTTISLVEQILGYAEDLRAEAGNPRETKALALASRVQFADALAASGEDRTSLLENETVLKILSSPKLPCPALYFKSATGSGAYIAKRGLDPAQHRPQGRKWYLHARPEDGKHPWVTGKDELKTREQKNKVQPIRKGKEFFFHIGFDNLTEPELGLLLFGLEPSEGFHHKVGMGKPLGLGTVKIDVLGVFLVDRQRRYTLDGLRAGRYHGVERTAAGEAARVAGSWPERYRAEGQAVGAGQALAVARKAVADEGLISESAQRALALLGDFAKAPPAAEVRYPTIVERKDSESEHFKWFVFNDGHRERGRGQSPRGQFLKPLPGERELPKLTELEWDAPPMRRY